MPLDKNHARHAASPQWPRRLAIVVFFGVFITAGFLLDGPVTEWMRQRANTPWKHFALFCTKAGDWPPLALSAVFGSVVARFLRARRPIMILTLMIASTIVAGAVVNPLRMATGRARPGTKVAAGWYGLRKDGEWVAGRHRFSAFPSAHTTVAAAFFTTLVLLGGRRWLPAWAAVVVIAWSRMYLLAHHPSDVAAGAVLGWTCAWFVCAIPGFRWWAWRFASALCGYRRLWPRWDHGGRGLLGGGSTRSA